MESMNRRMMLVFLFILLTIDSSLPRVDGAIGGGGLSGYKNTSPTQYHIQTDEGKERFFRYQTYNGQYRKERRLDDGTVIGSYGWVDPTGYLRMTDYIADAKGYRVVKNSMQFVGTNSILPEETKKKNEQNSYKHGSSSNSQSPRKLGHKVNLTGIKNPFVKKVVKKKKILLPGYQPSSSSVVSRAVPGSPPVLVVYGPLRSANVRNAKLITRRRRIHPQGGVTTVESTEEIPGDVFGKYTLPQASSRSPSASFIYRIPEQYHKEKTIPSSDGGSSVRVGSFGYVDPFGIQRVIHYTASNNGTGGFTAQRDFKYVGTRQEREDQQDEE